MSDAAGPGLSNVSYLFRSPEKKAALTPVVGAIIYKTDVVIQRARRIKKRPKPGKRGQIMEFSEESRKRLAFVASNTDVSFQSMITLTYPADFPTSGRKVKAHLQGFLLWLRNQFGGVEYLWFLEFQKRGAPHFHILLDKQPAHISSTWPRFQAAVATTWYEIVGSGDRKHMLAGTRSERLRTPEGGAHYAVKYAQKMRQKTVPALFESVGRFYGYSAGVKPKAKFQVIASWQDITEALGDWSYLPDKEEDLHRVLYNTAGTMATHAVLKQLPIFDCRT